MKHAYLILSIFTLVMAVACSHNDSAKSAVATEDMTIPEHLQQISVPGGEPTAQDIAEFQGIFRNDHDDQITIVDVMSALSDSDTSSLKLNTATSTFVAKINEDKTSGKCFVPVAPVQPDLWSKGNPPKADQRLTRHYTWAVTGTHCPLNATKDHTENYHVHTMTDTDSGKYLSMFVQSLEKQHAVMSNADNDGTTARDFTFQVDVHGPIDFKDSRKRMYVTFVVTATDHEASQAADVKCSGRRLEDSQAKDGTAIIEMFGTCQLTNLITGHKFVFSQLLKKVDDNLVISRTWLGSKELTKQAPQLKGPLTI